MRSIRVRLVAMAATVVLLAAGCTDNDPEPGAEPSDTPTSAAPSEPATSRTPEPSPTPTPTPSPSESPTEAAPPPTAEGVIRRIPDRQWRRIVQTGSWRPGCPAGRQQLRRIEINHHTFDGDVRRGVLVANRDVAESLVRIFTRLYDEKYPIEQMVPLEHFDGDSNASLRANNTAAYNCRRPDQINAPVKESPHANGRAIDINPVQNPWMDLRCKCWSPGRANNERTPGRGKILKNGLVWRLFVAEGWIWQNIDVPDYMHFDTGYPSKAFKGPQGRRANG